MLNLNTYQMIFTTLPLAFGVVFLIFYFFLKQAKENLYFAVFLFLYSASIFFDYQNSIFAVADQTIIYLRIHRGIQPFYNIFSLLFVYSLFYPKILKRFWLLVSLLLIFGVFAVISPMDDGGYKYFGYISRLVGLETFRVIIDAIRKKIDGAWLIAFGFFIFFLFSTFDTLMDMGMNVPFTQMQNPYAFGTIGFLVTMSIYLAKRYSQTYEKMIENERRIREKEVSQKILKSENKRKTLELEEARKLQLSMLPECINNIPGFDICFHMETATEVGGDYYDYHYSEDKTLTIAVGDATGHGMKAGTMVSVIKGLFISDGTKSDPVEFLKKTSQTLKKINLKHLYMALLVVKIKKKEMIFSSAGMPPIFIFRRNPGIVEEFMIKEMPLGGPGSYPYKSKKTKLSSGDVIILISDGISELFNSKDEMFGYERIKEILKHSSDKSATRIVKTLLKAGKKWRSGKSQDDDITLAVIRIK